MAGDHVLTMRNVPKADGRFGGSAAKTRFLVVPDGAKEPLASHEVGRKSWFDGLRDAFPPDAQGGRSGHLLAYVHGYNNSPRNVLDRHRLLVRALRKAGWDGVLLSFDWPSEGTTIQYMEDRREVRGVAERLVTDLILPFVKYRESDCDVNVSLIAHSMGGYLVREAFLDADDTRVIAESNWSIGQVVFVGADVSSSCFRVGTRDSRCFERHCARFTNYFTPQDAALKVSNMKRMGLAPRVGRVGLPNESTSRFVDVDCARRFVKIDERSWKDQGGFGEFSHSWYFGDAVFAQDLAYTLLGDIDRNYIPTRVRRSDDDLELIPAA
ncbi:MAG: alpha/beta hydrolase [Planctomycetes bacterium]|nr:alpha/beta hydrolase [Planctomycetota bacterium]